MRLSTFAPTMAAGILSVAARGQQEVGLSGALLLLGLLAFGFTVAVNVRALASWEDRDRRAAPFVLFTWVAACGVIGQRFHDASPTIASGLGLLAAVGFLGALIVLARAVRMVGGPFAWDVTGSWLLAAVAVQSLAIASATTPAGAATALVAMGLWVAGMATYGGLIALILRRIVRRHVGIEDLTPDYWIAMGALAISTVAATQIRPIAILAPVIWAGAAVWIPYLCVVEAAQVRKRGLVVLYDALRWSTVFPLGMFSVATFDLGIRPLEPVAVLFLWAGILVAMWNLIAGAANLRRDQFVS
ncbi:MAG TPA: hypothetical protein VKE27_03810 [Candidatus Dormibacteraeota bacterium]|nr:hypothetical protein [Candidatus Dormibacteraeota bacterium]